MRYICCDLHIIIYLRKNLGNNPFPKKVYFDPFFTSLARKSIFCLTLWEERIYLYPVKNHCQICFIAMYINSDTYVIVMRHNDSIPKIMICLLFHYLCDYLSDGTKERPSANWKMYRMTSSAFKIDNFMSRCLRKRELFNFLA